MPIHDLMSGVSHLHALFNSLPPLGKLYVSLIGWISLGYIAGFLLPSTVPTQLAKFLFWIGVPVTIVTFLYGANLSGWILIAPITAWVAILVGGLFARIWIDLGLGDEQIKSLSQEIDEITAEGTITSAKTSSWTEPTQGSFLLAMMVGNTGYMGFPIILSLVGEDYFAWALFYDLLGTFLAVYGVGVILASRLGRFKTQSKTQLVEKVVQNPALWSMGVGLIINLGQIPVPSLVVHSFKLIAWIMVQLALVLIGLQLSNLKTFSKIGQALPCIAIKMLVVPLVVGTGLLFFDISQKHQLVLVLQMAMPPAFSTLVFAEIYGLDRELAVTNIAFGCLGLLIFLPLWMSLFGVIA